MSTFLLLCSNGNASFFYVSQKSVIQCYYKGSGGISLCQSESFWEEEFWPYMRDSVFSLSRGEREFSCLALHGACTVPDIWNCLTPLAVGGVSRVVVQELTSFLPELLNALGPSSSGVRTVKWDGLVWEIAGAKATLAPSSVRCDLEFSSTQIVELTQSLLGGASEAEVLRTRQINELRAQMQEKERELHMLLKEKGALEEACNALRNRVSELEVHARCFEASRNAFQAHSSLIQNKEFTAWQDWWKEIRLLWERFEIVGNIILKGEDCPESLHELRELCWKKTELSSWEEIASMFLHQPPVLNIDETVISCVHDTEKNIMDFFKDIFYEEHFLSMDNYYISEKKIETCCTEIGRVMLVQHTNPPLWLLALFSVYSRPDNGNHS